MGQVPSQTPYLIVGSGRLSRHLQHYFSLESIPYQQWARTSAQPLSEMLGRARTVVLLITDDAIEGFLGRHVQSADQLWVHCSGSVTTQLADCAHPLMTFGDRLYDLASYRRIPFVCERGRRPFSELFPELVNPSVAVDPELKPLYHALCVLGGNFSTLLWQKVFSAAERRLGLTKELFIPYLEQVFRNLADSPDPLTGPLARGDSGTISDHLEALGGDPFQQVYRAFVDAYRSDRELRAR